MGAAGAGPRVSRNARATPAAAAPARASGKFAPVDPSDTSPTQICRVDYDTCINCSLCANCVKTCPNDAIELRLRKPTSELWFIDRPQVAESFLAISGEVQLQDGVVHLIARRLWVPQIGARPVSRSHFSATA